MTALSFRQPWAQLILMGLKRIEVRTWSRSFLGRLLVHASRTIDDEALAHFAIDASHLETGAVLGEVTVVEVIPFTRQSWRETADLHLVPGPFRPDLFGWVLEEPLVYPQAIPVAGQRGLFEVSSEQLGGRQQIERPFVPRPESQPLLFA